MLSKLNLPVAVPRVLLGLLLSSAGLMGLLHLAPMPPHEGLAAQWSAALAATYVMTLVKIVELTVGVALLTNRFVPLALVVLAPVTVNIIGFHTLVEFGQLGAPVFVLGAHLWLAWSYRAAYAPLFEARAKPVREASTASRAVLA
ncbi:MAG: DoxX family protein [Myxococcaceae bacterium]